MPDLIAPSGRAHWIGTGLSTGTGLGLVCARASQVVLWGRTVSKAAACLDRLGLTGRAQTRAYTAVALAAELAPGDVVVSMLPPAYHVELLRTCLDRDAHFACSSYVSDELAALAPAVAGRGLVALTEAGLDPGIDHLLAHQLVEQARAELGDRPATAVFTSYCGANPAVPNDFRYRFSWAPKGVLTALLTPARYVEDGARRTTDRPWEAVRRIEVGGEPFEVYPNRDSVPFLSVYGFPMSWDVRTFLRGTLRLDGWSQAWAPVFAELSEGDDERITALAAELAERHPATAADLDRVVLSVALDVRATDGTRYAGEGRLDVTGTAVELATPRVVSVPLAGGIEELLAGRFAPGLHRAAAEPAAVRRWLDFLAANGIATPVRRLDRD